MSVKHSDKFKRDADRIALTSVLTRRQVASDLSIGLSTLGKWIASVCDETKIPTHDTDLPRENERLRKENRILHHCASVVILYFQRLYGSSGGSGV